MRRRIAVAMTGMLLILTIPALAHHSFTNFWHMDQTVEITGVVKQLRLVNPHSEISMEVTEADGQKAVWYITSLGTGSALRRAGWKPDTLTVGTAIKIEGHPSRKAGAKALAAGKITKSDGSIVSFGGGGGIPTG